MRQLTDKKELKSMVKEVVQETVTTEMTKLRIFLVSHISSEHQKKSVYKKTSKIDKIPLLAERGGAFDFLNKEEDIYNINDIKKK